MYNGQSMKPLTFSGITHIFGHKWLIPFPIKNGEILNLVFSGLMIVVLVMLWGCSTSRERYVISHEENVPPLSVSTPHLPSPVPSSNHLPVLEEVIPDVVHGAIPRHIETSKDSSSPLSDISTNTASTSPLPWTLDDVFFDFDKMTLRVEAIATLERNAAVLMERYPDKTVLIQGHCDERGTEEYNFVLGERRAQAVKNYLVDLGIPPAQLEILSFGKTQPFCSQKTLSCFQKNRRAHFVLQ